MQGELQDVSVVNIDSNTVEVRFLLDESAPQPLSFTIDSPARISLDLPNTTLGAMERRKNVGVGVLNSIMSAEANGRTRIVLSLDSMVPYKTRTEGNSVVLTLGDSSSYSQAFVSEPVAAPTTTQAPRNVVTSNSPRYASNAGIRDVNFRRGC